MRAWDRSRLPFRLAASPIFSVFIRELALTEEGRGVHEHGGSGQRSPLSSAPPGAGGWDRRPGPVGGAGLASESPALSAQLAFPEPGTWRPFLLEPAKCSR